MKALGLDACRGKWLAVVLDEGRFDDARLASDAAALVNAWPDAAAIGVDIPIGLPETPLVATTAQARSGSTGAGSAKSTSSSGVTSNPGRARSITARRSRSDSRTSIGRKDAPEEACAARISSQISPGGSAYAISSPARARRCAVTVIVG